MLPEVANRGIREALLIGSQGHRGSRSSIKPHTGGDSLFSCESSETALQMMPIRFLTQLRKLYVLNE